MAALAPSSVRAIDIFNMRIYSESVRQTLDLGARVARQLRPGDIICLFGGLGSGKTVLAKGVADGLGVDKKDVQSPTFVIMRQYDGRLPLYHFDLYRLHGPDQVRDLGYEEYLFGQGVAIIEWAERLGDLTPESYLKVSLKTAGENRRVISMTAVGGRYKGVLRAINEDTLS
jgi:tRNA threonylcarbamoyladenosine biosynthesis protein TsaE